MAFETATEVPRIVDPVPLGGVRAAGETVAMRGGAAGLLAPSKTGAAASADGARTGVRTPVIPERTGLIALVIGATSRFTPVVNGATIAPVAAAVTVPSVWLNTGPRGGSTESVRVASVPSVDDGDGAVTAAAVLVAVPRL